MIVVLVLVTIWRVTRLFVIDEFPPIRAARMWWIQTFAEIQPDGSLGADRRWGWFGHALAYLWTCMWCMSVWVGLGVVGVATVWVSIPGPWLVIAAGSALSGVMTWVEHEHDQRWAARQAAAEDREGRRR
jgi:hypothetical protein